MFLLLRHIAVILIVSYMFVPLTGFAHAEAAMAGTAESGLTDREAASPCDHCPCNDEQSSPCCDTSSCSCSFHSPPVQGVQVKYAPIVIITRPTESFRKPPQVYSSIFVPPQNRFQSLLGLSAKVCYPLRRVAG